MEHVEYCDFVSDTGYDTVIGIYIRDEFTFRKVGKYIFFKTHCTDWNQTSFEIAIVRELN